MAFRRDERKHIAVYRGIFRLSAFDLDTVMVRNERSEYFDNLVSIHSRTRKMLGCKLALQCVVDQGHGLLHTIKRDKAAKTRTLACAQHHFV